MPDHSLTTDQWSITTSISPLNQLKTKMARKHHCRVNFIFYLCQFHFLLTLAPAPTPGSVPDKENEIQNSTTPPFQAKVTTDQFWIQESLELHNKYRAVHQAQPLSLNLTLCEISQSWANYLLNQTLFLHQNGSKQPFYFDHNYEVTRKYRLGENLYFITHRPSTLLNASLAVRAWYNEVEDYDFETADFTKEALTPPWKGGKPPQIGHFTQLVWNSTREMGTARAEGTLPSGAKVTFVVANYYPGGNVLHYKFRELLYLENVFPSIYDTQDYNSSQVDEIIKKRVSHWKVSCKPEIDLLTSPDWSKRFLRKANSFRELYGFPDLELDENLSGVAESWAEFKLKELLVYFNQQLSLSYKIGVKNFDALEKAKFGESFLLFLTPPGGVAEGVEPERVAELWYRQAEFYDFQGKGLNFSKSLTAKIDDFEQLLWKSSKRVGLGISSGTAENGQTLSVVVAYYYPSGPSKRTTAEEKDANLPDKMIGSGSKLDHGLSNVLIFLLIKIVELI